ncbi:MAG: hypothetical protein ACE5I9_01300 [Candidatus Methylomirabilales bacterium]
MRRIIVRWFVMTVLALITLPLGGESMAQPQRVLNRRLRGDYAFTLTRVCVNVNLANVPPDTDPFVGAELTLGGPASVNTMLRRGTLSYNGDGTGSLVVQLLIIVPNPRFPGSPVKQDEGSCQLTYEVNPDNSFMQNLICENTRLAGTVLDQVATSTGIVHQGQISKDGRVLILSDSDVNEEILKLFRPPLDLSSPDLEFRRICWRNGTAVKVE